MIGGLILFAILGSSMVNEGLLICRDHCSTTGDESRINCSCSTSRFPAYCCSIGSEMKGTGRVEFATNSVFSASTSSKTLEKRETT
jgi:hypothetical protein